MSEVSELRDIFFNRLEKTSYGRNQIKQLFDDCYFNSFINKWYFNL